MNNQITVEEYINQARDRWLDYSVFHSEMAKTPNEGVNTLNAVLELVQKKGAKNLQEMVDRKTGPYTDLDYLVLRMIKFYIHSNDQLTPSPSWEDALIFMTPAEYKNAISDTVKTTLAEMGFKGSPTQSGRVYRKHMIETLGRSRFEEAVRRGWLKVQKHDPSKANSKVYAASGDWERFLRLHTNQRA